MFGGVNEDMQHWAADSMAQADITKLATNTLKLQNKPATASETGTRKQQDIPSYQPANLEASLFEMLPRPLLSTALTDDATLTARVPELQTGMLYHIVR
jgi:hypothetical protein